jgi:hypothetical protein
MANNITRNAKRDLFNMEIRTVMSQDVCTMMSFVIKWLAEGLIMTGEFLPMNAGILTE